MLTSTSRHAFGGLYSDLDALPVSSTSAAFISTILTTTAPPLPSGSNPFSARPLAFLGQMAVPSSSDLSIEIGDVVRKEDHQIPNAWMASARGHPFWIGATGPIEEARKAMEKVSIERKEGGRGYGRSPEWVTGPVRLRTAYLSYQNISSVPPDGVPSLPSSPPSTNEADLPFSYLAPVILLPPPRIYPFSWAHPYQDDVTMCACSLQTRWFDEATCVARVVEVTGGKAWVISLWGHGWSWQLGNKLLWWFGMGPARVSLRLPLLARRSC